MNDLARRAASTRAGRRIRTRVVPLAARAVSDAGAGSAHLVSRAELDEALDGLARRLDRVEAEQRERGMRIEPVVEELVQAVRGLWEISERTHESTDRALAEQTRALQSLTARLQALPYVAGEVFTRLDSPVGEVIG
jgi:chromosome segregation ATPase